MSRNRREEIALNLFMAAFAVPVVACVVAFFWALYG